MLTAAQIRMARGCLRWSVKELAEASGVSSATIRRMEEGEGVPNSLADNLGKLQRTLEAAGLEFIPENGGGAGIRFRDRKDGTRDEH
ncbi:helix-turn-helix transcriptional regulator [Methylobacterium sp. WL6]|uniref:helix-turn-helix domain-containing protein n=1 Tax=Methylobacterium sp. WL6 TaxID=2603901 RepID=UPI0011C84158|nr:helix-turn-helix transcriptional regulator [Methylobacterium sp. WL6]TXN65128.1 helix-turn-helix domain-containing protein [Methylobacterium sp. WL6]